MHCLITAGATIEPVDEVRFITNNSTGKLGASFTDALIKSSHEVTLLLSESARFTPKTKGAKIHTFTTASTLATKIKKIADGNISVIFHMAAVSDFSPTNPRKGKIDSSNKLSIQLDTTPKIINELRNWYPESILFGWKYDVEGNQESMIVKGNEQMTRCHTDYCVLNGPAYGTGFGLLKENITHCPTRKHLIDHVLTLLQQPQSQVR